METKSSTIPNENVFFLLIGALFSALIILGGGGFVAGDVFLFSFLAFLSSLTPVFFSKKAVLKPYQVKSIYQPLVPRKNLTHRNDPLLM